VATSARPYDVAPTPGKEQADQTKCLGKDQKTVEWSWGKVAVVLGGAANTLITAKKGELDSPNLSPPTRKLDAFICKIQHPVVKARAPHRQQRNKKPRN